MSEVVLHTTADAFQQLGDVWNKLARSILFRELNWHRTWWKCYGLDKDYGRTRQLYLLSVRDEEGEVIGIAPWYLEKSGLLGRVIRTLGSGEVCTDHLTLLCQPCHEYQVAESIASYLVDQSLCPESELSTWQLLELESVSQLDTATRYLVDALQEHGITVNGYPAQGCWRLELPGTVEDYSAMLGASMRKKLRSAERNFVQTGKITMHIADTLDQLDAGYATLRELHQSLWNSRGLPGAYASQAFTSFHEEFMLRLMRDNALRLTWLEYEGRPVAAEYDMIERDVIYNYQVGRDPTFTQCRAGDLLRYENICWAIRKGCKFFDFLRGDEPYKAEWRAVRTSQHRIHAISTQAGARLRHGLWSLGRAAKHWLKRTPAAVSA